MSRQIPPLFPDWKEIDKKFEAGFEQLTRLRGDSMTQAKVVVDRAREEIQARTQGLRNYIDSDAFERDLDQLAVRLKLDSDVYPPNQSGGRAKAKCIFTHSRKEILLAIEKGGAFSLFTPLSRRPKVLLAISAICGGIKAAEILTECYEVFMPAVRRRGLHVV